VLPTRLTERLGPALATLAQSGLEPGFGSTTLKALLAGWLIH